MGQPFQQLQNVFLQYLRGYFKPMFHCSIAYCYINKLLMNENSQFKTVIRLKPPKTDKIMSGINDMKIVVSN